MQADIFEDLCKSIWEHGASGSLSDHSRMIAQMLNPKAIREVPDMGAFAVVFSDMSVAICGARGSSVIATFSVYDHADPDSYETQELGSMAERLDRLIEEAPPIDGEDFLNACKAVEPNCTLTQEDKGFTVHFPDGSTYTDDGEGRSACH